MNHYVVTRKSDGEEVYRYDNDVPVSFDGFEFSTHDHTEVGGTSNVSAPVLLQPRRMTKLDFIGLLTDDEFRDLLLAARVNVDVEKFVRLMDWATPEDDKTSIDRDDPRTIAGVRAMFLPKRADEILGVL